LHPTWKAALVRSAVPGLEATASGLGAEAQLAEAGLHRHARGFASGSHGVADLSDATDFLAGGLGDGTLGFAHCGGGVGPHALGLGLTRRCGRKGSAWR
jgi:hypothetical protein